MKDNQSKAINSIKGKLKTVCEKLEDIRSFAESTIEGGLSDKLDYQIEKIEASINRLIDDMED